MTEQITTRSRARENDTLDDAEKTPLKKGKLTICKPLPNIPSQPLQPVDQELITPVIPPVPTNRAIPPDDDDNKSIQSVKSNTSSARLRKLTTEREANRRLHEIEIELLKKEREAILKDQTISKAIAEEQEKIEAPNIQVNVEVPPVVDRNELVKTWVQNEPLTQADHPYAMRHEFTKMNSHLEQLLARQTIPKDLPNFSGDPADWFGFIYLYEHTTELCGLTPQENMVRLNKCLTGRARQAVAPLLCMPENLPIVISTLKMLFGRANQIVQSIIDKTRSLPHVTEKNPETIITFANSVNNLVATISSLKEDGHMNNPSLMEEFVGKLPPSLQLQWRLHKNQADNLKTFSVWMMQIATAAASMPVSIFSGNDKPSNHVHDQPKRQVLTTYDVKLNTFNKKCPRCKAVDHDTLAQCSKFLSDDIENRWNLVSAKRLCFSCLTHGHQTGKCPERKSCGINGCQMPHNSLLHRNEVPIQTNY